MLSDKNIIVTGSNRGIGKAILEVLASNGANIFACSRKKDNDFEVFIQQLSKEYGVKIIPIYFDLCNKEELKNGVKEIRSFKMPIDGLVNNAGAIFTNLFTMTSMDNFKQMFEINYFAQVELTQYIVKLMMREKKGSIVNISSSAAIEANEGRSAYAGAKSALITTSKVLAKEVGDYNIRVNVIAPGLTDTDMMNSSTKEDAKSDTLKRVCLKRVAKPKEIANVVLFLLSDLSSYVTNQVIRVDGGM
jgi:3-oxoacyl-[acyl-carrier protein] reductase